MTSADASGFAAAKEGLKAISGQTQWINQQVGAGKLSLDPEAAEKAAKRCDEEKDELQKLLRYTDQMTRLQGLGNYPDGQQLAQRFVQKAADGSAGAAVLIRQLMDEIQKQADAFRAAAKDYRATDEQISADFQRGIQ
ncbi:hypothetical protein [Saccharopolyspora shandongensis]|uniref:hypothetical protein n=1 Tax=Saccharopolyspora shandongensis TaxID=418495 RepID=UPI003402F6E8